MHTKFKGTEVGKIPEDWEVVTVQDLISREIIEMPTIGQVQLGKNGITPNFIETLKNQFKKHENVKISVLKSASRDKKKIKEFSEEIIERLGKKYTEKIIGFTIFVKKWRRAIR